MGGRGTGLGPALTRAAGAFAAALSGHPVPAHAVGEVAGSVLEQLGERPDLAVVVAGAGHAGALEDVVGAVDALLHPLVLVAATAGSVVGPHREVGDGQALALLAGRTGPLLGLHLTARAGPDGPLVSGWPAGPAFEPSGLLLLGDAADFAAADFLDWLAARHGRLPVVGGLLGPVPTMGTPRLALGPVVHRGGAVGVLLGPGTTFEPLAAPTSRPFGRNLVVTASAGPAVLTLDGRPALERLVAEAGTSLGPAEVRAVDRGGLRLGVAAPGAPDAPVTVHEVLGTERASGALVTDGEVPEGATVRFRLADAASAGASLARRLRGRRADAAVLFPPARRGPAGAGARPEAPAAAEGLGPVPLVGAEALVPLAPAGGRNRLQPHAAAVALLRHGGTPES